MPFGLYNATTTVESLIERVLKGLDWKTRLVYLDNIIVMDRIFSEHLKNLAEVMKRISMAGLKLSVMKCAFFQKLLIPRNFMNFVVFWGYAHTTDAVRLTLLVWLQACMS